MKIDELEAMRPPGSVPITCSTCRWTQFADPLSESVAQAATGTFVCTACVENPLVGCKCKACNRQFKMPHRELQAQDSAHRRCPDCMDIPPMQFASVVWCWQYDSIGERDPRCGGVATQLKRWPKHCDCPACWQTWYHLCDYHASDWINDKSAQEQQAILRQRGAIVIDEPDGGWSIRWPEKRAPGDN